MKSPPLRFLIASVALALLTAGLLLPWPWLARESVFEFMARMPRGKSVVDFSFDSSEFWLCHPPR